MLRAWELPNSGVMSSGGIWPWLHESSECFNHWAYRNCTRIGSSEEKPWEKPYQIGLTHLGKDLPECDVHPAQPSWSTGPPASWPSWSTGLLLHGHPSPLVLLFLGQFFPFEEPAPAQVGTLAWWPFATASGLHWSQMLPWPVNSYPCWCGMRQQDSEWQQGGQMVVLIGALPQCLLGQWDDC